MKVPIQYKSSDRYNAGVDVIYDDDSKLQFAPFIYATTQSGDNGDDGGDEEGEDSMVIHWSYDENYNSYLDKTWQEIVDAINTGKIPYVLRDVAEGDEVAYDIYYVIGYVGIGNGRYTVTIALPSASPEVNRFSTDSTTGYPTIPFE